MIPQFQYISILWSSMTQFRLSHLQCGFKTWSSRSCIRMFGFMYVYIYIYTHTIFWDITAPSISSTHQIYTSWLSMLSRWVKTDALIARRESLFELFVLIFCSASFWCPIIFTCFEILDPDINQKDTRVLVACVLMYIPYNIRMYVNRYSMI